MHDDVLPHCVREYLDAILALVSNEADRNAVFNLRSLLRTRPPDTDGYFFPPEYPGVEGAFAELVASYSAEPLRGILVSRLDMLRRCEDEFTPALLNDLCRVEVPSAVRSVRVRAWVASQLRLLREEVAGASEASVGPGIADLLTYTAHLTEDVVAELKKAEAGADAGDRGAVLTALIAARHLLTRPDHPEASLRAFG